MFPPDLRDWIPGNDIVHFIIDAVEFLDLQGREVVESLRSRVKLL